MTNRLSFVYYALITPVRIGGRGETDLKVLHCLTRFNASPSQFSLLF